jgi:hypothetical protein
MTRTDAQAAPTRRVGGRRRKAIRATRPTASRHVCRFENRHSRLKGRSTRRERNIQLSKIKNEGTKSGSQLGSGGDAFLDGCEVGEIFENERVQVFVVVGEDLLDVEVSEIDVFR